MEGLLSGDVHSNPLKGLPLSLYCILIVSTTVILLSLLWVQNTILSAAKSSVPKSGQDPAPLRPGPLWLPSNPPPASPNAYNEAALIVA
jgi:hypothetical protein